MSLFEHIEKLRHFMVVADSRSISDAAKSTGMSQAGLSKSIAILESVLGNKLIIRSKKGLSLTEQGRLVLVSANKIMEEAGNLEKSLIDQDKSTKKIISLNIQSSLGTIVYPAVAQFLENIGRNDIQIVVREKLSLKKSIDDLEVECAIISEVDSLPEGFDCSTLYADYFALHCSSEIQKDLSSMPIFLDPSSGNLDGKSILNHLSLYLENRSFLEVHDLATIKEFTCRGLGIGVLPMRLARDSAKSPGGLKEIKLFSQVSRFARHHVNLIVSKECTTDLKLFSKDLYAFLLENLI